MPTTALTEVYRILTPGGIALFNFHHLDMIPKDLRSVRDERVRAFWTYLRENQILFRDETQILTRLQNVGYKDVQVGLNTDRVDKWWEISGKK